MILVRTTLLNAVAAATRLAEAFLASTFFRLVVASGGRGCGLCGHIRASLDGVALAAWPAGQPP
jgi:hypothetical protein